MDFGKDVFPALRARGARLLGYRSPEYIKDIGTPERYERVNREYAAGVVARSSLATPQRAVFLDRDGTLNEEVDGVGSPAQLRLLPGVAEATTPVMLGCPFGAAGGSSPQATRNPAASATASAATQTAASGRTVPLPFVSALIASLLVVACLCG